MATFLTAQRTLGNATRFDLKYSCPLRAPHWLVILAVLIAVAAIEVLDFFPKGSAGRAALFMPHQTAGLSMLTLIVLRLLTWMAT